MLITTRFSDSVNETERTSISKSHNIRFFDPNTGEDVTEIFNQMRLNKAFKVEMQIDIDKLNQVVEDAKNNTRRKREASSETPGYSVKVILQYSKSYKLKTFKVQDPIARPDIVQDFDDFHFVEMYCKACYPVY